MSAFLTEDDVEKLILEYLAGMGWGVAFGPDIGPDGDHPERRDYRDVTLPDRLRDAIRRLNPQLPPDAVDEAARKASLLDNPSLFVNNRGFHKLLLEGVPVEYAGKDGPVHDHARLIDFDKPNANDFLAVNQFTVVENSERRLDIVLFINGLPLVLFELKNPAGEQTTIEKAFRQLQTYKQEIPAVFQFNELLVISDGWNARVGTLTADWERFTPWRTIDGKTIAAKTDLGCEVLTKGMLEPTRLLDVLRSFIAFEDDGQDIAKKVAAYHQYHAVNKAVERTVQASQPKGNRRIGVVWHTQGSGKSLSMAFFAGKIIQHPKMENPTLVVLTDRNDLDDQLFGTFSRCQALFRQKPVQAERRSDLQKLLSVASGGVIFTTIQKFLPEGGEKYPKLSDRRNIVVIADEAHRSQYGFIDGLAKHMRDALPNASFIGFTGTPIELDDKSTPAVFGDYIDVYDIQRAVDDGATVPIYYEGRLAKLKLRDDKIPKVDKDFEEVTEGEEVEAKEKLKSKWAKLEAMVGTKERLALVAKDIVDHFEKRLTGMDGKGMIVCMSRRVCVELYNEIVKLRPQWHNTDDKKGFLKVVMTGSASDKPDWQQHIRNKAGREALAKRFKVAKEPFKLVIVRDMWLTGFDAPCLHTMYVDKPMRGHGLMQAIARVNRVFGTKPGGLIVDYLGLAYELKRAMADYTQAGGKGSQTIDLEEAVEAMVAKLEVVRDQLHGHDYAEAEAAPKAKRLQFAAAAMNFILQAREGESSEDRKKRFIKAVTELLSAFALAVPHEKAIAIRDELAFFQLMKSGLVKLDDDDREKRKKTPDELDTAVRQIVSAAVSSNEVIDVFKAAGLQRPDVSILSEEFLQEVKNMPHRNLALDLLRKLLNDEIKLRGQRNIVQSQAFSEMLQKTILRYQNRTLEAAEVIAELIDLAKKVRDSAKRGENLGLNDDEVAFYDALEVNDSAVKVLGEPTLKTIAQELVKSVRGSVTIDWNYRESAQAKIRLLVKKILKKYGYPPDKQQKAVETVLEQAKLICRSQAAS